MLLVASASDAKAVTPTAVPVGGVFVNCVGRARRCRSTRSDVEFIDVVDVDRHHDGVETAVTTDVARTVILWLAAASRSSSVPLATVTTPVDPIDGEPTTGIIVQCVGDRVVGRIGVGSQRGDTPTVVPLAAFSSTALAVASLSVTGPTSNSSTSLTLIVITTVSKLPSLDVARTVMLWLAAASRSSSVPLATVTTPVIRIDGEPTTGVIVQRVGDRVVGRIGVGSPER